MTWAATEPAGKSKNKAGDQACEGFWESEFSAFSASAAGGVGSVLRAHKILRHRSQHSFRGWEAHKLPCCLCVGHHDGEVGECVCVCLLCAQHLCLAETLPAWQVPL